MELDLEKPETIYQVLKTQTGEALSNIADLKNTDVSFSDMKERVINFLTMQENKISHGIDELKQNSEWNTFTIAFYGETNAGKSTVIETLRILLEEKTKLEEINNFKRFEKELGISEDDFKAVENSLEQIDAELSDTKVKISNLTNELAEKEKNFKESIRSLLDTIETKKKSFNFIERVLHFLKIKKIQEETELKLKEKEFSSIKDNYTKSIAEIESQNKGLFDKEKRLQDKYAAMCEQIKKLETYEDGKIIGDGRSDFTKENHIYKFEYGDKKFNLIDVPGIEGSEQKVMDSVWEAVKKAHAVFYVTTKAARPQTGDKNQKGTLEKIKEHLGMQTEVRVLYNKRINNPRQLNNLISEDEKNSLSDLDAAFSEFFGKRYCGYISMSALPAFLSVSECLAFSSSRYKQRAKFFEKFSKAEILNFSNGNFFKEKLEMISIDFPNKIRKSNFFKASCVLNDVIDGIKNELEKNIVPTTEKLSNEINNTNKQIDFHVEKLQTDLKSNLNNIVRKTKSEMQQELYDYIDSDVSNGDFKSKLKSVLESSQEGLAKNFEECVKRSIDLLYENVEKTIKNFKERVIEIININSQYSKNAGNFNFDVELLDIKSIAPGKITEILGATVATGLSVWGLVAAVGAVLGGTGPIGAAIVAGLAVVSSLIVLGKAVFGILNHEYRKSEQRKNADKALNKFEENIKNAINDMSQKTYSAVKEQIAPLKDMIAAPMHNAKKVEELIKLANDNLINLQKDAKLVEAIA